jgi:hypothetical protein
MVAGGPPIHRLVRQEVSQERKFWREIAHTERPRMPKGPPPLRFVSEMAKKIGFHFIFLSSTLFTFPNKYQAGS